MLRPKADLSVIEKIESYSIPFRENLIYRALMAMAPRLYTEFLMLISAKPLPLSFKSLHPRYDLIEKYGHVPDDALSSINSHCGIAFFKSRGYLTLNYPSLYHRIMARGGAVIVKKPV